MDIILTFLDRPMATSSMSITKQAQYHLAPNCSRPKHPLPTDPLLPLDHERTPSLTDPKIHAQDMAQGQTVPHHGDESTIAGMM